MPGTSSFHQFRNFPIEIQHMVWKKTWKRRKVMIRKTQEHDWHCPRYRYIMTTTPTGEHVVRVVDIETLFVYPDHTVTYAKDRLPVTLFINRESRSETLRHYRLAFRVVGGESRTYFNFALDTLIVLNHDISLYFGLTDGLDIKEVERLILMDPENDILFNKRFSDVGTPARQVEKEDCVMWALTHAPDLELGLSLILATCPKLMYLSFRCLLYYVSLQTWDWFWFDDSE